MALLQADHAVNSTFEKNRMYIEPEPTTTGETIAFDYYSNAWCQSSGGTAQQRWSADLDTYKLDEDCFVQGLSGGFTG